MYSYTKMFINSINIPLTSLTTEPNLPRQERLKGTEEWGAIIFTSIVPVDVPYKPHKGHAISPFDR